MTGQIARVQMKSTLERKVNTRALKGLFLVRKWINNTLSQILCDATCIIEKISCFSPGFGLCAVFASVPNSRICQHCDVKTSTVTPILLLFYHLLDLLHQCIKFHPQSMLGS